MRTGFEPDVVVADFSTEAPRMNQEDCQDHHRRVDPGARARRALGVVDSGGIETITGVTAMTIRSALLLARCQDSGPPGDRRGDERYVWLGHPTAWERRVTPPEPIGDERPAGALYRAMA